MFQAPLNTNQENLPKEIIQAFFEQLKNKVEAAKKKAASGEVLNKNEQALNEFNHETLVAEWKHFCEQNQETKIINKETLNFIRPLILGGSQTLAKNPSYIDILKSTLLLIMPYDLTTQALNITPSADIQSNLYLAFILKNKKISSSFQPGNFEKIKNIDSDISTFEEKMADLFYEKIKTDENDPLKKLIEYLASLDNPDNFNPQSCAHFCTMAANIISGFIKTIFFNQEFSEKIAACNLPISLFICHIHLIMGRWMSLFLLEKIETVSEKQEEDQKIWFRKTAFVETFTRMLSQDTIALLPELMQSTLNSSSQMNAAKNYKEVIDYFIKKACLSPTVTKKEAQIKNNIFPKDYDPELTREEENTRALEIYGARQPLFSENWKIEDWVLVKMNSFDEEEDFEETFIWYFILGTLEKISPEDLKIKNLNMIKEEIKSAWEVFLDEEDINEKYKNLFQKQEVISFFKQLRDFFLDLILSLKSQKNIKKLIPYDKEKEQYKNILEDITNDILEYHDGQNLLIFFIEVITKHIEADPLPKEIIEYYRKIISPFVLISKNRLGKTLFFFSNHLGKLIPESYDKHHHYKGDNDFYFYIFLKKILDFILFGTELKYKLIQIFLEKHRIVFEKISKESYNFANLIEDYKTDPDSNREILQETLNKIEPKTGKNISLLIQATEGKKFEIIFNDFFELLKSIAKTEAIKKEIEENGPLIVINKILEVFSYPFLLNNTCLTEIKYLEELINGQEITIKNNSTFIEVFKVIFLQLAFLFKLSQEEIIDIRHDRLVGLLDFQKTNQDITLLRKKIFDLNKLTDYTKDSENTILNLIKESEEINELLRNIPKNKSSSRYTIAFYLYKLSKFVKNFISDIFIKYPDKKLKKILEDLKININNFIGFIHDILSFLITSHITSTNEERYKVEKEKFRSDILILRLASSLYPTQGNKNSATFEEAIEDYEKHTKKLISLILFSYKNEEESKIFEEAFPSFFSTLKKIENKTNFFRESAKASFNTSTYEEYIRKYHPIPHNSAKKLVEIFNKYKKNSSNDYEIKQNIFNIIMIFNLKWLDTYIEERENKNINQIIIVRLLKDIAEIKELNEKIKVYISQIINEILDKDYHKYFDLTIFISFPMKNRIENILNPLEKEFENKEMLLIKNEINFFMILKGRKEFIKNICSYDLEETNINILLDQYQIFLDKEIEDIENIEKIYLEKHIYHLFYKKIIALLEPLPNQLDEDGSILEEIYSCKNQEDFILILLRLRKSITESTSQNPIEEKTLLDQALIAFFKIEEHSKQDANVLLEVMKANDSTICSEPKGNLPECGDDSLAPFFCSFFGFQSTRIIEDYCGDQNRINAPSEDDLNYPHLARYTDPNNEGGNSTPARKLSYS